MSPEIRWTNASVRRFMSDADVENPLQAIARRAQDWALEAIDEGWTGPPFDPFELATRRGVELVARQDLEDARLVSVDGKPRIEFNPNRRPARVRFSVAHELGHFMFSDYAERPRHRGDRDEVSALREADEWQLELLCNLAAAELLMPEGALAHKTTKELSLVDLLDLRAQFGVSTEALLNRIVRLSDDPVALFAAARDATDDGRFRVDYTVSSRSWTPPVTPGSVVTAESVLSHCTAVGYADSATETWGDRGQVNVQAVGIPPYPGHRFPRIAGLLRPTDDTATEARGAKIRYVRGDASRPSSSHAVMIAHVVNDRARRWGGQGFAKSLGRRYPSARDAYAETDSGDGRRDLGTVHTDQATDDVWIASIVAQVGYGESARPRLRLPALRDGLRVVADEALERDAEVHMPLIGTGQGGIQWPAVRDLILDCVCRPGVNVVVYVLPEASMPEDQPQQGSLLDL
jgi:Zn-dependent peptidase ImmA (M78 family)/O-acetyl-ADP-ribose deacetylase (regulator of RNase III)